MGTMWDVAEKELADSFSSRRFILLLLLFLGISLGSVYMGLDSYQSQMDNFRNSGLYGHIPEKPSLVEVFEPMFNMNMPLAAALLALLLSYNAISGERESGTLAVLLSYPVYRDEVINGKFLANAFTLSIALLIAFTASSGFAIFMTGEVPTYAQLVRIWSIWLGTIVYMGFFLSLGTLFSTVFRSSWRALIASAVILAVFLATPMIAGQAANMLYPYPDRPDVHGRSGHVVMEQRGMATADSNREVVVESEGETVQTGPQSQDPYEQWRQQRREVQEKRQQFQDQVAKLSPSTSYRSYVETMLGTNYHSDGAGKPALIESLQSALGYLMFLISQTALLFALSYAVFMRQDL